MLKGKELLVGHAEVAVELLVHLRKVAPDDDWGNICCQHIAGDGMPWSPRCWGSDICDATQAPAGAGVGLQALTRPRTLYVVTHRSTRLRKAQGWSTRRYGSFSFSMAAPPPETRLSQPPPSLLQHTHVKHTYRPKDAPSLILQGINTGMSRTGAHLGPGSRCRPRRGTPGSASRRSP